MIRKSQRVLAYRLAAAVLLLGAMVLSAIIWDIHRSVVANCRIAEAAHPHAGDDVAALIDFVSADEHSLSERNHIGVWTLGRLCDSRALPTLESYYTGEPCEHDTALCQHELAKAIKRCGGAAHLQHRTH